MFNSIYNYFAKNNRAFYTSTIILIVLSSTLAVNDENMDNKHVIFEGLRFLRGGAVFVISILFYLFFVKKSSNYNYFYNTDKFYCVLIYVAAQSGIALTLHYLNGEMHFYEHAAHDAVKVWEILSFTLTFIYTLWIWGKSKTGANVRRILYLYDQKKLTSFLLQIFFSLLFLTILTIGHSIIFFDKQLSYLISDHIILFMKEYSIQFSISFILLTYLLYYRISKSVLKYLGKKIVIPRRNNNNDKEIEEKKELESKRKEYLEDFAMGLKYADAPIMWIFVIMFIYAGYCTMLDYFWNTEIIAEIELFFSGAIAFELLLTSIIWAKFKNI